jgi:hypothetical protein
VAYAHCVGQQIGERLAIATPAAPNRGLPPAPLCSRCAERIVSLALPDKKYEHNQSSLYKVRRRSWRGTAVRAPARASMCSACSLGPFRPSGLASVVSAGGFA